MQVFRPEDAQSLGAVISEAAAVQRKLEIRGGGSKADFGAPREDISLLDMSCFTGIEDYDPAELVITLGAATPLSEVQTLVAGAGQMLAFDPFDHGPVFGRSEGSATIGGVIAANASGARRLVHGAVRDHFLGFEAVSGRGEHFIAGGRVVKNVTGYDLSKLMAGSWGRLAALTKVSLKVLPCARSIETLQISGCSPAQAVELFADAIRAGVCVAGAAYLPAGTAGAQALAMIRLEGFPPSVEAGVDWLEQAVAGIATERCELAKLDAENANGFWQQLKQLHWLESEMPLWRIAIPASAATQVTEQLQACGSARWVWDWAGGLTWAVTDVPAEQVRAFAAQAGGHAMLVRAPERVRATVPALHPQSAVVSHLEEKVRRAFDPQGVFETGRFRSTPDEN